MMTEYAIFVDFSDASALRHIGFEHSTNGTNGISAPFPLPSIVRQIASYTIIEHQLDTITPRAASYCAFSMASLIVLTALLYMTVNDDSFFIGT